MQVYDINIDQQMKETTQHGSLDFPFAIYETQLNKNVLGFVNWHWHNELQFCYVVSGRIMLYVNNVEIMLKPGQGFFINKDVLHMIKPYEITDSKYVCINVHPSLLYGTPGNVIEQRLIRPFVQNSAFTHCIFSPETTSEKQILLLLSKVHSLYTEGEYGYELDILISLLNVWREIILIQKQKLPVDRAISETDENRIKSLLLLIHNRYKDKLTLKDFSDEVHLCSSECCRLFKRHMGCTIFEYVIDYRIEKSIDSLCFSDLSISQIAYDCGFGSTSYYIEKFRKKTGMTPLEYKKSVCS
ncbi:MAG: AraC family transcriptional regulator [Sedimentibacter sp.]|uniref:AraC family transcriptional regulator n=1 Tax=Sedimentibacter sp. TaxID=1960295 RepID=UPI00315940C2